jgi:iron complex outermembrane receptor protein
MQITGFISKKSSKDKPVKNQFTAPILLIRLIIICFILSAFGSKNVLAQKLSDTISIEEVQVFGKRKIEESGISITHIDTIALQMMKTQTISELLSSYSPVFIKSYGRGSAATASFRGTASSHTQVYWNGVKINSPMRGDVDFSLFPVYFIDDISLQHGGSSLQSGSGALGGSVLINNKPDWTDRFSIKYIQTAESFGTYKEYLNVGYGNEKLQFKTRLFADQSKNNFPYFNYGVLPMHDAVQNNADYSKKGLLQEIYARQGKHFFAGKFWAYSSRRNLPQLMSFEGDVRNETQDDANFRGIINWKYLTEKNKLELAFGVNWNQLDYFRSSTEASFVNFDSRSSEKSYSSQLKFDHQPSEKLSFNWSLHSIYHTVSVFDYAQKLGYEKNRFELSLLNSAYFQASERFSFSFLLRSELYDQKIIGAIPSLGVEYFLNEKQQHSLKLNLARNYHQPGLNDLYWIPGGNPNLKPENGYSGDISLNVSRQNANHSFSGQLTGFVSLIDNWIVWQPSANGAYYWEASNLRKVFSRGVELQLQYQKKFGRQIQLDMKGNYSHSATSNVDAVPSVDESRGKQLIYIPKDKANLFAELNFNRAYLKINAPFTGKRYTSSNNVESDYEKILNPYWLVNCAVGKKIELKPVWIDVSLNIENLLNTDYMAILWRPMPGRYYSATIQIQYKK